jgi:hypothetical protein
VAEVIRNRCSKYACPPSRYRVCFIFHLPMRRLEKDHFFGRQVQSWTA